MMACVYGVRHKATDTIRLVEADNQAQALRHVAGSDYEITRPSQRETNELARRGVFVEEFGKAGCAKCRAPDVVTNLDGEDLCQDCASKWVRAEGQAVDDHDAEAAEVAAEQGER